MKTSKMITKDPICGMTVDEATAIHTEREGRRTTFAVKPAARSSLIGQPGRKPGRMRKAAVVDPELTVIS